MHKGTIRIISLPRMRRLKLEPAEKFRQKSTHVEFVGRFTPFENMFKHHPDGGDEMYRIWFAAQINDSESKVYKQMSRMFGHYHYGSDNPLLVLIHDEETPPLHTVILKEFIESNGAKL